MGVSLKSETLRSLKSEKAEAAPHLHVPRPDGDVEAEVLRSPVCPGPGRRFPAEEKLTCLSGVTWAPSRPRFASVKWGSIDQPLVGGLPAQYQPFLDTGQSGFWSDEAYTLWEGTGQEQ